MNNRNIYNKNGLVTTAVLLAAGTGSRLYPLTQNMPKCLTLVNGVSILERLVSCLKQHGFKRLIVVTGYLENRIRESLENCGEGDMAIDYIFSPLYETTNNIYSLWMAREMINDPFLLIESDIIFDVSLLDDMLYPNRIAVARMQPWMNGSTVTVNQVQHVTRFYNGTWPLDEIRYKTVNMYSLSLSSWHGIAERLDRYISTGRVNKYYEAVFSDMVADGSLSLQAVSFDDKPWYEIDTITDLAEAEKLFSADKYKAIIPYNITSHTSKISRQFFQQTKSREVETITRSLPGLRPLPHPGI
ncbi:MAG: phosphocholine cytidylyltransferase family protein [Deltaproteobacteria bacterium]|nr:phosphocholine cytidylyltransferase family protein [Deltaproteobacteria bacterium]